MNLTNAPKWLAFVVVFIMAICLAGVASAEETAKLTGKLDIDDGFRPGQEFDAELELKIAKGFHINCDHGQQPIGMPLNITLEADNIIELKKVVHPEATKAKLAFSKDPVPVFEDEPEFRLILKVSSDAAKGKYKGKLVVEYQGCDDNMCYMPELLEFPFEYVVE